MPAFEKDMSVYESMMQQVATVQRSYVDMRSVLGNIMGWRNSGERVHVLAGAASTLIGTDIIDQMANEYRDAAEFAEVCAESRHPPVE